MKRSAQLLKFTCTLFLFGFLIHACRKNPVTPEDAVNTPNNNQKDSLNADIISNHLQFFNDAKKQGAVPKGPPGSSLKISFKDTLHLVDDVRVPIKFLHEDTTKDVAGVYVQVYSLGGAIGATYYYDVPELPEMADNDSVSVILIGIDPDGLVEFEGVPPAGSPFVFNISLTPYGGNGQPLGQTVRPVIIDEPNNNPDSGSCGLVLPEGDYWKWDNTQIVDPNGDGLAFYNDDDKKWGWGGQFINGCCINGKSSYNINCSGNTTAQRKLKFPTWFWYVEERMQFFPGGTFMRHNDEVHVLPDPVKSDFCGTEPGVVEWHDYSIYYFGNWTVTKLSTPYNGDSFNLTLLTTSTTGGTGFGRSGGIIHRLDCNILVLIRPDREGQGRDEVSYFARIRTNDDNDDPNDEGWYVFT